MRSLRAAGAFTVVVLRGLARDRAALFFMVVLPVVVIAIIGATFGGTERLDIGVVQLDHGPLSDRLASDLDGADGLRTHHFGDAEAARRAVRRSTVSAALIIEEGTEAALQAGSTAEIGFVANPASETALTAQTAVSGLLAHYGAQLGAAHVVSGALGSPLEANLAAARELATDRATRVTVVDVGGGRARKLSRFALVAPSELVLFVFINSMASAVLCVQARRNGILRRTRATPASVATVIVGLALGWLTVALVQSAIILSIGALAFGVTWGSPGPAAALVLAFALVGCGAGLLVGAVGRNEDRVGALTPIVGLVCGALGGAMVPYEVFPPAMQTVAHGMPHYWALVAWHRLIVDGAGFAAIAPSLAVLGGFAMLLLLLATLRLRREMVSG